MHSERVFEERKEDKNICILAQECKIRIREKWHTNVRKESLIEFEVVISNELLKALPTMRSISYQMDLIPGSSLPNKAPYKLTPTESEEINRQVQELLD